MHKVAYLMAAGESTGCKRVVGTQDEAPNQASSLRKEKEFLEDNPTIKVPSSCQELSL